MARHQKGSLKRVMREEGESWVLRYRIRRSTDDRWVEATPIFIGTVKALPSKEAARRAVDALNLNLDSPRPSFGGGPVTFGELASHYLSHELPLDQGDATIPKDNSTASTYRRYLRRWVLPRWRQRVALAIEPLEVERWLKDLGRPRPGLANATRWKIKELMNLVFRHGIRYGLLPRNEYGNPIKWVRQSVKSTFEPVILTLPQAFEILEKLDLRLRTMVLVDAATGLRVSEILALTWADVDWKNQAIHVRRKYVYGVFGEPKSKASKAPVPLHPILAAHLQMWRKETPYANDEDLIFPSLRRKLGGKKPPAANMLVADHLRPAAVKAGVKASPRAFGFHTFRRTLASVLVANRVDPKIVQEALRHQGIRTTLEIYAKTITANKLEAQGMFLNLLFEEGTRDRHKETLSQPADSSDVLVTVPVATKVVQ